MKPSEKSDGMVQFIDHMAKANFGRSRTSCVQNDLCVSCDEPAVSFRDELSRKEYTISGLCQTCQDGVFGVRVPDNKQYGLARFNIKSYQK